MARAISSPAVIVATSTAKAILERRLTAAKPGFASSNITRRSWRSVSAPGSRLEAGHGGESVRSAPGVLVKGPAA
jgi:hypothetical protein